MRDATSMVSPLNQNPSGLEVRSGAGAEDVGSATAEDQFDVSA